MADIEYGKKYGRLTIIDTIYPIKNSKPQVLCICECGNTKIADFYNVRSGRTSSCGCLFREGNNKKHGEKGTRLYRIWTGMIERCKTRSSSSYPNYGGRGITVCSEWHDYLSFKEWAINSGYNDNLTIDRINVNGNYEPSNCRWATRTEQANNRRTSRLISFNGETRTLTEWAKLYSIPPGRLWARLHSGWEFERALKEQTWLEKEKR